MQLNRQDLLESLFVFAYFAHCGCENVLTTGFVFNIEQSA